MGPSAPGATSTGDITVGPALALRPSPRRFLAFRPVSLRGFSTATVRERSGWLRWANFPLGPFSPSAKWEEGAALISVTDLTQEGVPLGAAADQPLGLPVGFRGRQGVRVVEVTEQSRDRGVRDALIHYENVHLFDEATA